MLGNPGISGGTAVIEATLFDISLNVHFIAAPVTTTDSYSSGKFAIELEPKATEGLFTNST